MTTINETDEIFREIVGYENYKVSNFGNVMNITTGRILKFGNCHGYYIICLSKNSKQVIFKVHRLVAIAFLDNTDEKRCVDHIDGIKTNNNITNLRYATHAENNMNRIISNNNTSGVKGVNFNKNANKWHAYINIKGIKKHIGYFDTIEQATHARQEKAKIYFQEFTNACEQIQSDVL